MAEEQHAVIISYDARDLLDRLGKDVAAGFATMGTKLDGKADKYDVIALQKDIAHMNARVSRLETDAETRKVVEKEVEATHEEHVQHELDTAKELAETTQRRWNYVFSAGLVLVGASAALGSFGVHL